MSIKTVRRVFRRTRATAQEIAQRIKKAKSDPNILGMGIVEAMRRYELNYASVIRVRNSVMEEKIVNGQAEDLLRINNSRELKRLRSRVLRAEHKFPLIHRRLVTEKNMSAIARDFNITRERVRQIKKQLEDFRGERTVHSVLDEIEEECRS